VLAGAAAVAAGGAIALATAWSPTEPQAGSPSAVARATAPPWAAPRPAADDAPRQPPRPERISLSRLRARLAAADRGGSPIAIVRETTALRRRPRGEVLHEVGTETEFGSPRVLAVVGHDRRWLEVMAAELDNGETGWIRADAVRVDGVVYALRASLAERELEVRRRGRVVRRVPVAVGAPDTPTPTGRFAVTDKLEVTDESPYGCCALAFTGHQPSVPQGWAGGDRLAVHATPHAHSIGDAASLGCLRAGDEDMRWLIDRVALGTIVKVVP
jgi:hypothetical protein